jgi:hypothetical protein
MTAIKVARVTISVGANVRMIVYSDGGMEVKHRIDGIGWCLMTDDYDDQEILDVVRQAREMLADVESKLS